MCFLYHEPTLISADIFALQKLLQIGGGFPPQLFYIFDICNLHWVILTLDQYADISSP